MPDIQKIPTWGGETTTPLSLYKKYVRGKNTHADLSKFEAFYTKMSGLINDNDTQIKQHVLENKLIIINELVKAAYDLAQKLEDNVKAGKKSQGVLLQEKKCLENLISMYDKFLQSCKRTESNEDVILLTKARELVINPIEPTCTRDTKKTTTLNSYYAFIFLQLSFLVLLQV